MIFKAKQKAWVDAAAAAGFPAGSVVGYTEIDSICESMGESPVRGGSLTKRLSALVAASS